MNNISNGTVNMLLARHGTSEHNLHNKGMLDAGDLRLTVQGIQEWQELGRNFLSDRKLGAVALAPNTRVSQSFAAAEETASLQYDQKIIDSAFGEYDWGEWAGHYTRDVFTADVEADAIRTGKDFRPPGGETISEKGMHMYEALADIKYDVGLVISSSMAIKSLIGTLLDWDRKQIIDYKIANAEVIYFNPLKPDGPVRVFRPVVSNSVKSAA